MVHQAYGRELAEAGEWCRKYRASRKDSDLHQAWDLCAFFLPPSGWSPTFMILLPLHNSHPLLCLLAFPFMRSHLSACCRPHMLSDCSLQRVCYAPKC